MTTSSYFQYLPAVLQQDPVLGDFLKAFEHMYTGYSETGMPEGLELTLDRIHTWFDPVGENPHRGAPEDFLPWLADWVAVSLRQEWSLEFKRQFIRRAVSLHRKRGTREGVREVLQLLLPDVSVEVSRGDPEESHFFRVSFSVHKRDPAELARLAHQVSTLVDQQKPAHTVYALEIHSPSMQISHEQGKELRIGKNTLLGRVKFSPRKATT
ncbi:phage tail protein I [Archangium primigenium]|uniref:phage tail protein I n=1 Tax=[Archangium] primigenium TaxID=2792470 RepID=UPI00195B8399|nr:phage tail protein I [Archangium primigenium]MBM7116698.1 phage tail protein I [Archangium primigenium]